MSRLIHSRVALTGLICGALLAFLFVLSGGATQADAAGLNQGEVVPEVPRNDLPVVTNGTVFAHAQVGNRIFVGGSFTQVEQIDGTVIDQANVFAYDINSGQIDQNFRPNVSNTVRALEARNGGDGLYVGGNFGSWDGVNVGRVVRLDAQGNLITSFQASATGRVTTLSDTGGSLYIGGDFDNVSGLSVNGLAKVSRNNGVVDTSFAPQFTNLVSANGEIVRTIDDTPSGDALFVLHYAQQVEGQTREAVAKFDINNNNATLSGWNIPWSAQAGQRGCQETLRDLAVAPNGNFLVIGGQGDDLPPNCDSVLRYPTGGSGTVNFDWSARMYSSVFSLAVSDVAVYVGGHFCAAPANPIPNGGVSSTNPELISGCNINNPNDPVNPSVLDSQNAVFRNQMAALNPGNGQALAWDPGSNNFIGVFDLTLIDRGLLAGHDTNRFNDIRTGRSGLFDFSPPGVDTTAPEFTVTSPLDGSTPGSVREVTGVASDDRSIDRIVVRLQNLTTGQWLNNAGDFTGTRVDLTVAQTNAGVGAVEWVLDTPNLAGGEYRVSGFAGDDAGNTGVLGTSDFTIADQGACTVSLNGNAQPVLSLSGFDGVNNIAIRRNGTFLEQIPATLASYVDTSAAPGPHSYVVRSTPGGVQNNVSCSPSQITVPTGGALECNASVNNAGNVVLSWNAIAGESIYIVRDNDGFVAEVGNTAFTDINPESGQRTYVIRYRVAGENIDTNCSPSVTIDTGQGTTMLECSASVNNAGNVVLSWNEIPGESTYIVRDNDGFVATVNNATAFTDTNPTQGQRTYVIRYRDGGNVDTNCAPTVTVNAPGPINVTCNALLNNDQLVEVTWTAVPGVTTYSIRDDGGTPDELELTGFVGSVDNQTTFVDNDPVSGTQNYVLRYRSNGANVQVDCGTVNVPNEGAATCSAVLNNNGSVALAWTAVRGETNYVVRDNDGFIADVNGTQFTVANPAAGTQTYVIRYREFGANVDITCSPGINAN